ncbi:CMP-sialic acid transporter 5 [Diplonema papillatum]|nr:CMP-sialic acid transporter 5 [Diplonema papillatum]
MDWSYALMGLISVQAGLQPILVKRYTQGVDKSGLVFLENAVKIGLCVGQMLLSGGEVPDFTSSAEWWTSLSLAALPAAVYALGGWVKLVGYRATDGVTFNTLIQLKLVFSSVLGWALFSRGQTPQQLLALGIVVATAVLVTLPDGSVRQKGPSDRSKWTGVVATVASSALSAFAAVLCQVALQDHARGSILYSAELAFWGSVFLLPSVPAGIAAQMRRHPRCVLPLTAQAAAGIAIGFVIRRHGSVAHGFCTVLGVATSAVVESVMHRRRPKVVHLVGIPLVVLSTYLYTSNPPV